MTKKVLIVILSLCFIALITTIAVSQTRARSIAEFIKKEDSKEIVMTINSKGISKSEFLAAVEVQKRNIEKMKIEKQKISTFPETKNRNNFIKQIDKKLALGENKLAAAKLLYETIIFTEAEQKGVLVSLDEAKQYADNLRQTKLEEQPDDPELNDFISALGEDYYWNSYAPKKYQIGLSAAKLKQNVTQKSTSEEIQKVWYEYLTQCANNADIDIKDNSINVSRDELITYISTFID